MLIKYNFTKNIEIMPEEIDSLTSKHHDYGICYEIQLTDGTLFKFVDPKDFIKIKDVWLKQRTFYK